jgi:hypothetical protein
VEDAHWLLGAHLLAGGDPTGALREFEQCNAEHRPLYEGYALLAQIVFRRSDAERRFDQLLERLRDGQTRSRWQPQVSSRRRGG